MHGWKLRDEEERRKFKSLVLQIEDVAHKEAGCPGFEGDVIKIQKRIEDAVMEVKASTRSTRNGKTWDVPQEIREMNKPASVGRNAEKFRKLKKKRRVKH